MNTFILGLILFSSFVVSPLILPVTSQVIEEETETILFSQAQESPEIPIEIYNSDTNTISSYAFDLTHRQDGAIIIKKDGGKLGGLMFAITGNDNGQNMVRFSSDFDWSWNVESEDINVGGEIKQKYYLTGDNGSAQFPIKQTWGNFYEANDPKVTYKVTNNFRRITNTKFWFIQVLKPNDLVEFAGVKRFAQANGQIHLKESDGVNLADKIIKINNKLGFDFSDLNANGWKTTDIYIGRADIIDRPNLVIVGVAVTKNNGVFPLGASVELDPTIFDTSIVFFTEFSNNVGVTNPHCLLKANAPPKGCFADFVLFEQVDLNTPAVFGWPFPIGDINITAIEIRVSAKARTTPCIAPEPSGVLRVRLSGDANASWTDWKSNSWVCTEGESIKSFGIDNWGVNWDEDDNLSTDKFKLQIQQFPPVVGQAFSPGVGWVKIKVHYTKKCIYSGSGDYDCNCTSYIPNQGIVNIGTNNLNVFNDDGNETLQIDDSIFAINDIFIETGCSVELTRGTGRLNTIS